MTPAAKRVLVTGAGGFVMSVFITELLARNPETDVIGLDVAPLDKAAEAHFARVRDRVTFHACDVRDPAQVAALVADARPDLVVHGATVTHVPAWEFDRPHPFVDVNVSGTMNVLEAVRAAGTARKIIHVSSCAVYGHGDPSSARQGEDGPFRPADYYGIGKLGGELVARRFAELHGIPVPVVRFTRVFGPMERPTGARKTMHMPFVLAARMLAGRSVRVTKRSARSVGDWISVEDVADAMLGLATSDTASGTYNIATGRPIGIGEVLTMFPVEVDWVDDEAPADVDHDPALRHGQNGVYDVSAIARDLGWTARPLAAQVASYIEWARANPVAFAS